MEKLFFLRSAIGIVVEILFCGFDNVQPNGKTSSTKKIATDSPTRAVGKALVRGLPK